MTVVRRATSMNELNYLTDIHVILKVNQYQFSKNVCPYTHVISPTIRVYDKRRYRIYIQNLRIPKYLIYIYHEELAEKVNWKKRK